MMDLHYIQIQILRELLFNPKARFTNLNISGLTSDHFTYHIKSLLRLELVKKERLQYFLTSKGKEFANTLDTERFEIEKQAKIGVFIIATKFKNNEEYLLVQTRLKEPYYGFKGFITGKIRFGETILETAQRELLEETGLSARFEPKYILHEHVYSKQNELLEDKFFHVIHAFNTKGELKSTKEGKNEWLSEKEFLKLKNIFYDEEDILKWFHKTKRKFIEKKYYIDKF